MACYLDPCAGSGCIYPDLSVGCSAPAVPHPIHHGHSQVIALEDNVKDFGITYFDLKDNRQGIVHIIGPEQGFTLPGCTTVCGDSHTATHGAFGSLAFGIGTSEARAPDTPRPEHICPCARATFISRQLSPLLLLSLSAPG